DTGLLGLHPEAAARVGLARLGSFVLERLPGADDVYCFWARSRAVPEDERLFVLAEVRGRTSDEVDDAALHIAAFERVFHQATSALRALRSARDPRRRLHWNRITIAVGPAIALDAPAIEAIARRLMPAPGRRGRAQLCRSTTSIRHAGSLARCASRTARMVRTRPVSCSAS